MINRSLLCLALVAASGAAFGGGLLNGDFSDPNFNGSGFATLSAGSTDITSWTVIDGIQDPGDGSVDLVGDYWQAPPLGGNSVDLDGDNPGGVEQSVYLTNGQTYDLSFYLSGNPDGGSAMKVLVVGADGSQTFDYTTGSNDHGDMDYVLETATFTATNTEPTVIEFQSDDASNSPYGPVIGNVSLQAVPEPFTIALGAAGVGLAVRRRVRKNG